MLQVVEMLFGQGLVKVSMAVVCFCSDEHFTGSRLHINVACMSTIFAILLNSCYLQLKHLQWV